jgi:hypothetical protein
MPQDYKDYVSANGGIEGQVFPTVQTTPGVLSTANLAISTAQLTTQVNPGVPAHYGINSIVQAQQQLAVVGPIYNSPGGILNKQNGSVSTGGGP